MTSTVVGAAVWCAVSAPSRVSLAVVLLSVHQVYWYIAHRSANPNGPTTAVRVRVCIRSIRTSVIKEEVVSTARQSPVDKVSKRGSGCIGRTKRSLGLEEAAGWIGVAGVTSYSDSPQSAGFDCAEALEFKLQKSCFSRAPSMASSTRPHCCVLVWSCIWYHITEFTHGHTS